MPRIRFVLKQRPNSPASSVNRIQRPQRAILRQVSNPKRSFVFPYGPQAVDYSGDALRYETTDRAGTKPILTAVGRDLRSVRVEAVIADQGTKGKVSVESQLDVLRKMASEDVDCTFTYGVVTLPYRVRITSIDFTSIRRTMDGNITQAQASFELQESVQPNQSVVTLTAITYEPDPVPEKSTKNPPDSDNKGDGSGGGGDSPDDIEPTDPDNPGPNTRQQ